MYQNKTHDHRGVIPFDCWLTLDVHFFGLNLPALLCASVSTSAVRFLHSERRGSEMEKSLSRLKQGHMAPGGEQSVRSPRPQSDIFVVSSLCSCRLSSSSAAHASIWLMLLLSVSLLSLTHTRDKKSQKGLQEQAQKDTLSPHSLPKPHFFLSQTIYTSWYKSWDCLPLQEPHQQSGSPLTNSLRPEWMTLIHTNKPAVKGNRLTYIQLNCLYHK